MTDEGKLILTSFLFVSNFRNDAAKGKREIHEHEVKGILTKCDNVVRHQFLSVEE